MGSKGAHLLFRGPLVKQKVRYTESSAVVDGKAAIAFLTRRPAFTRSSDQVHQIEQLEVNIITVRCVYALCAT
jgi:hypothetical protein